MFGQIERRELLVAFRVTEAEKRVLEAEAQKRGLDVAKLTRQALGQFLSEPAEVCHDADTRR